MTRFSLLKSSLGAVRMAVCFLASIATTLAEPSTTSDPSTTKSITIIEAEGDLSAIPKVDSNKLETNVYIVEFKNDPIVSYDGDIGGLIATKPAANAKMDPQSAAVKGYRSFLTAKQNQALANCGVAQHNKIYEYTFTFNGMAAAMTAAQAELMRKEPEVLHVEKDRKMQLQTDSTRKFLELNKRREGAWRRGYTGEDVIVGVLDSGISPEHPSFADVATPRRGDRGRKIPYGPPPAGWNGGECNFGNTEFFAGDLPFECNNKLLGARFYVQGFLRGGEASQVLAANSSLSARDDNGHGSAAASHAAGNYGVQAVINGEEVGDDVLSGVAPRARIAAYKVCWDGPIVAADGVMDDDDGCFSSDSMAAIDQAVADGVDVINFSIGGPSVSFAGADTRAFLAAAGAGVHVATSAGNSGSDRATVGTPAAVPWITAVGAINDDQNLALAVSVSEPANVAGNKLALEGSGPIQLEDIDPISRSLVLTVPADACTPLTNPDALDGNIALVIRGGCGFDTKYAEAETSGAVAIIVYNDGTAADRINPIVMGGVSDDRTIPGVMIGFSDGDQIANSTDVVAILDSENEASLENTVVGFSSRGENRGALDIIKPDVVAPGVNILGAESVTENADEATGRDNPESFQFISGTSFSSPHVAGVMALLKQAHPTWSPAAVRSALMTSARQNLVTEFDNNQATPFDIGAGHVVPNDAFEPGLVYDAGLLDYAAFSCGNNAQQFSDDVCNLLEQSGASFDGSELNLPSIGIGELIGTQTVTRTVTNVNQPNPDRRRQAPTRYRAVVDAPDGVKVRVKPRRLRLRPGQSADYTINFEVENDAIRDEFAFGSITWVERGKRRRNRPQHRSYYGDYFDYFYRRYFAGRNNDVRAGQLAKEVRSPIAVRPLSIGTPTTASSIGTDGTINVPVEFGYSGDYNAAFSGMARAETIDDVVTAADGLNAYFVELPAAELLRLASFDEDTTVPGSDDLDLQLFTAQECGSFDNITRVGVSALGTSEEVITLENTEAGCYLIVVEFFAAANGGDAIDFKLFLTTVAGDAGNTEVEAPDAALIGTQENIVLNYADLDPDTRYIGFISHQDAEDELARTILEINTQ